jgi:hypothetical protein
MSWSVTKKSSNKNELKTAIQEQEYMPEVVKQSISNLIDSFADRRILDVASYGHHSNERLANVSITLSDAGPEPE